MDTELHNDGQTATHRFICTRDGCEKAKWKTIRYPLPFRGRKPTPPSEDKV